MDSEKIRQQPLAYEEAMQHGVELVGIYRELGRIASESSPNFELDEDALAERLIASNEDYDVEGELFMPIIDALTAEKDELQDKAFAAGIAIAENIKTQGGNARKMLTSYLQACFQVDRLKVGTTGTQGSMVAENSILFYARQSLIEGLSPNMASYRPAVAIANTLLNLYKKDDWFGWFFPKIRTLEQEIGLRNNAHTVTKAFSAVSQRSIAEYGGQAVYRAEIRDFVERTMRERKYGVKAAYIPASIGGSWVFYDGEDFKELYHSHKHASELMPDAAAVIFYTEKETLDDLVPVRDEVELGGNAEYVHIGGALDNMQPKLRLVLSYSGELFLDVAQFMPLEKELRASPGLYEAILAEVISNFHDLTVPVGTIDTIRQPNVTQLRKEERTAYDPIVQLLIPRLKKKFIGDAEEGNVREVRLHDVTWFVRTLPVGFRASPDARERAKAHNILLAPNETFVRSHKRGSNNAVQGHVVEKRLSTTP